MAGWQRCLPDHISIGSDLQREFDFIGHTGRVRTAELWPFGGKDQCRRNNRKEESRRHDVLCSTEGISDFGPRAGVGDVPPPMGPVRRLSELPNQTPSSTD